MITKVKRLAFFAIGTLLFSTLIYLSFKLGFYIPKETADTIWKVLLSILFLVIFSFIILSAEASITDGTVSTVLLLPVSFFVMRNNKWVYHDELGYFLACFEKEDVVIYQQNILYAKDLFKVDNNGNVEYVSGKIKSELDRIYSNKIMTEKKENAIKSKIDAMKKWDGYLDQRDRRDNKIKKILK